MTTSRTISTVKELRKIVTEATDRRFSQQDREIFQILLNSGADGEFIVEGANAYLVSKAAGSA